MVAFTAHLSVTIKRLTRYKQKIVLATMLEGKSKCRIAADAKLVILEAEKLAKVCVEVVANSFCSEIRISNTSIFSRKFELVAPSTSEQMCFEFQNNFNAEF